MLHIDHTLPLPSSLSTTLFLSSNMGTARRASEIFPSKTVLAEERVPDQEHFNAFHADSTSRSDKSFHIHFFWGLLTHLSELDGGFVE